MIVLQVIGHRNSGKTTLVSDMIRAFREQGYTVGSIKHSAHDHELDKKGKDSWMHRQAGAAPAAVMVKGMAAIYLPGNADYTPKHLLETYCQGIDIVIIEGWISGPYPKIEVVRAGGKPNALFASAENVIALTGDNALKDIDRTAALAKGIKLLPRDDIPAIASFMLKNG